MTDTNKTSGADVAPTVYAHGDGWLCTGTGSPQWLHNCRCPEHGPQGETLIDLVLERAEEHAAFQAEEDRVKSSGAWLLDVAEAKRARAAVAALIERNAELEAERNMLGQAIADAAHKAGITHADALIDGPTLLLLCEDLANCAAMPDAIIEERDALAAEVKALREKLADLADAADEEMECGFNVPATPSRRILRAAIDAARASAATGEA